MTDQPDLKKEREDRKKAKQAEKAAKKNQNPNPEKEKWAEKKTTGGIPARLKKEYVNPTPKGEKKDLSSVLADEYDPPQVEAAWYDWWEKEGFFSPEYFEKHGLPEPKEKFVIVIPPPNVTGSLHIGHALTNSVEDCICRWHRMNGKLVLWVPGTDHAGIATQSVVEKKLRKQGKSRRDMGRQKFLDTVWEWKDQYWQRIVGQLRRLGSSYDWTREVFTLDDNLSKAVTEAFVLLHQAGLIFRDKRLVNWSCALQTAISDVECDDLDIEAPINISIPGYPSNSKYSFGYLWSFAYKVVDSNEEIVIATTRPETILGDTAVAVHPDDERYKHLHGKFVQHPFLPRKIPIVTDAILVDKDFGTGAVKITPGHDPNDYLCGKRNKLEFINIFTDDGVMNENTGEFKGLKRFDARIQVIKKAEELGIYKGKQPNKMRLKKCSRSGDIIEPLMKPQWWADMKDLAKQGLEVVEKGELKIYPESREKTWNHFLLNIEPWCISRQLWWGHRIPAYLLDCTKNGDPSPDPDSNNSWIIARNLEEATKIAKEKLGHDNFELFQDEDVLDTWFSSGLFPFSVFGWPNNTADLEKYFPTTLLETGYDIIFFWVARMVMLSLQLTGKLPFSQVQLLHSMIRDAHGRKMSKSLGNVIDPIDVIEGITLQGLHDSLQSGNLSPEELTKATEGQKKDFPNGISECGTDALRFALCDYTSQGRDINLDIKRVEGYRNFCNKIWNLTKFALTYLGDNYVPYSTSDLTGKESLMDKWILSKLNSALEKIDKGFTTYEFGLATSAIHSWTWYDFCDIYIEAIKPIMLATEANEEIVNAQDAVRSTLYTCLDTLYTALSPFMPFLTEELWQRLPRRPNDKTPTIALATYPKSNPTWNFLGVEADVVSVMKLITSIRSLCQTYNIIKKGVASVTIHFHQQQNLDCISNYKTLIPTLAYLKEVNLTLTGEIPPRCGADIPNETCVIYLHLEGLINVESEKKRLTTKLNKTNSAIQSIKKKMQSIGWANTPADVKQQEQDKLTALELEANTVQKALEGLEKM